LELRKSKFPLLLPDEPSKRTKISKRNPISSRRRGIRKRERVKGEGIYGTDGREKGSGGRGEIWGREGVGVGRRDADGDGTKQQRNEEGGDGGHTSLFLASMTPRIAFTQVAAFSGPSLHIIMYYKN
jgi:hypothetical protein